MNYLKICAFVLLAFFCTVLFSSCANDEEPAVDIIHVAEETLTENFTMQELEALNDGNLNIDYYPNTTRIKTIKGCFSTQSVFNPEDAVFALGSVRELFQIEELTYSYRKSQKQDGSCVYHLTQMHQGLPVRDYGFRLGVNSEGVVEYVSGEYWAPTITSVEPFLSAEDCAKYLTLIGDRKIKDSNLVVYVYEGQEYLCWEYRIESKDPMNEQKIYSDTATGKKIAVIPMAHS